MAGQETVSESGAYTLESNPEYLGFQKVEITEVDDSKPWKPPVKAKVTKADGDQQEIDANTPFFSLVDKDSKEITVSAASAGHIDDLHIKGEDPGSRFDYNSVEEMLTDIQDKLPEGLATSPKFANAFAVDMGKEIGTERLATMQELFADGTITQSDIDIAEAARAGVGQLNKTGDQSTREAFVTKFKTDHPDCKIQFKVIRGGTVIVPIVISGGKKTSSIFMVVGTADDGSKTVWTAAPGRNMPRHPVPSQFRAEEGGADGDAYAESAKAWFDTAMLVKAE